MIFNREKKNPIQRYISKEKRKLERKIVLRAIKGDRKAANLVKRSFDDSSKGLRKKINDNSRTLHNLNVLVNKPGVKRELSNIVEKQTIKNRMVALELTGQQIERVNKTKQAILTTKKVFVNPFQKKKNGKIIEVEGFWKNVKAGLSNTTQVKDAGFLNNFSVSGQAVTASANATKVISDGKNKYVMKSSTHWSLKTAVAKKLGINYDRKYNLPVMEAVMSDLGKLTGVRTQETILIPKGVKHKLTDGESAYTLHKFLPGKSLWESVKSGDLSKEYNASFKFNPSEDKRTGKYFTIDQKMDLALKNKDLSKIFAFGTAFSNQDMHGDNIWYDKSSKRFSLIDQGESLNFIPDFSSIKGSINNNFNKYDSTQKRNLKAYKNTLVEVRDKVPPDTLNSKIDHYLNAALGSKVSNYEKEQAMLNAQRKKMIYKYNHSQISSLIDDLNKKGI